MNFRTAVLALALATTAQAQQPWQHLQNPTAAEVQKLWLTPPPEYGPEPYFGMNGAVTIQSLAHDLDTMKSLGFHAVTAQAGGGMSTTYLTPEYFAFFKQFVLEAKRRDMRVWIVDDIGYPSGFAGGIFANDKPSADLQMQALTIAQRIPAPAGAPIKQPVPPETIAVTAISSTGEEQPIPVTDHTIDWTAPAGSGDWTVLIVTHVRRTSPTKSDTNPTHAKDSTQPLEDYLNPAATAAFLRATHEGYYKAMPEEFGTTILGFRGDEPDYSIPGLPWTPALLDTFQHVKGYDIRPYLAAILMSQGGGRQRPAAATPPPASPPSDPAFIPTGPTLPPAKLSVTELRAKGDYYDVFSQLFRDGFFKPQAVWCAEHHVEYQTHLNHEEMEMDLTRSEGEFLRDMQYVQNPGIDSIWHQIDKDTVSDFPRLAASAAHVYGHPRAFTETFAAYRPAPDITEARYILNEQIVRGVNLIETMFYPATRPAGAPAPTPPPPPTTGASTPPPMRRGGPSTLMLDPGWPALMQYVQRLSYVLSMGRPAAEVALFLPSDSMWINDRHADDQFVAAERLLSEHQVDFDIVNLDALAGGLDPALKAGKGTLETASGNSFHTVILPAPSVLSEAALARLKTFAAGGGRVLFLGRTPTAIYAKAMKDARTPTPADFAFATLIPGELPTVPTPPAQAPESAPGPMIVPEATLAAFTKALGPAGVSADTPDPALKVLTRRLKDADVFLFFNEGPAASAHSVTLHTAGKHAQLWDPVTGTANPIPTTPASTKDYQTLKLDLKPYTTELITIQ